MSTVNSEKQIVAGYTKQDDQAIQAVNIMKQLEAQVLAQLDKLTVDDDLAADRRWLAIARTKLETGFMAANRAVFKPQPVVTDRSRDAICGWVIEDAASKPSRPLFLGVKNGLQTWGYDASVALRFARENDAQAFSDYLNPHANSRIAFHECAE